MYREAIEIHKNPHSLNTRDDSKRIPFAWHTIIEKHGFRVSQNRSVDITSLPSSSTEPAGSRPPPDDVARVDRRSPPPNDAPVIRRSARLAANPAPSYLEWRHLLCSDAHSALTNF